MQCSCLICRRTDLGVGTLIKFLTFPFSRRRAQLQSPYFVNRTNDRRWPLQSCMIQFHCWHWLYQWSNWGNNNNNNDNNGKSHCQCIKKKAAFVRALRCNIKVLAAKENKIPFHSSHCPSLNIVTWTNGNVCDAERYNHMQCTIRGNLNHMASFCQYLVHGNCISLSRVDSRGQQTV